jgi:protein involved in polysaccharide export with SLBB domain
MIAVRTNLLTCFFAALVACCPVIAQQSTSTRDGQQLSPAMQRQLSPEVGRENENRVAASPEQIRAVLAKNAGLLVELKHYVAREATSNGQLVDDADLTDQAIFDRLGEDIVFRAAATRLVQRYGYLLPDVNPDSEIGKQQELVIKERARRVVQIEAQEDAESLKPPSKEDGVSMSEARDACDPRNDVDCTGSPRRRSHRELAAPGESPAASPEIPTQPNQIAPLTQSPLIQTELRGGSFSSATLGGTDSKDLLRLAATDGSRDPFGSQPSPADMQRLAGLLKGDTLSAPAIGAENSTDLEYARRNVSRVASSSSGRRVDSSFDRNGDSPQGGIIHKVNPYSDVPSLYDLYVQANPQGQTPRRFGLDTLSSGTRESTAVPMDLPVGPDYVVGPGDGLSIDIWGGVSQRLQRVVDREGRISLPESGPVLVSGRSLGDVQLTVQQLLRTQYRDISADVSLSKLRTVRLYVVGEVVEPGAYDVSSLSSPLNALVAAGGLTQRGSLRSIKHYRGKQLIEVVDAYDLLLRGEGTEQKRLENGDSLLIPPVGAQVTIEGMVRRPAIYELRGETTLESALELAGGILPAAALKHVEVERLVAHQKRTMFSLDLSETENSGEPAMQLVNFRVQDGDRIHIFPIAPYNDEAIYLQGHVLRPGRYSYREGMSVKDLISSYSDLLPEPAGNYAEIIRINPPDFHPTVESFDLTAALANPGNAPKLKPLDTIRIFGKYDFEPPPDVWVGGEVRAPGQYTTSGQAHLRDAVYLAGGISTDAAVDSAQLFRTAKNGTMKIMSVNLEAALAGDPADNLLLEPHDRVVVHRNAAKVEPPTVYVKGDVAKPGRYPLTSNMHVQDLVRVAGGLKRSADSQGAILTHREDEQQGFEQPESLSINLAAAMMGSTGDNKLLNNGDVLTIRQNPGWNDLGATVTLRGQVRHPGTYGIRPGESLRSVLEKAGGFTAEAYPYGTVLTRREVREMEIKSNQELVARVKAEEVQLKALPENDLDQKNLKLTAIAQAETTLTQLQTNLPVGRVVIHASADAKSFAHAADETPLRNGDVILVPQKPNYVLVQGQVFHPTAVGFVSQRSAKWYLGQSGGLTQLADKKGVFVIRADGSVLAAKNSGGLWSGDPLDAVLMPGDLIVVPERAAKIGTRNWTPLIQAAQVATSVALAVAYFKP